jgi:iron complex transport system substrate-binding protein
MDRVVSLLPSSTEIVHALGLSERLVGRSHECDHPPELAHLPVLTEPKLDAEAPSAEIDARVKQLVSQGLSVYRVDAEALRRVEPTVILTQTQCEVCAASANDVEAALAGWVGHRPRVVSLEPETLDDVWQDVLRVADALGEPARGAELAAALADRVTTTAERTQRIRARPSVACLEWLDPLMAAGNWVPELVTLAGGRNLLGQSGAHSPWLELAELAAADPDVIVALPCGFDLARTRAELPPLAERPEWQALRAVREGRVYLTDGNQYFNRPGPRLVDSLEILAEILHPGEFAPAHRGTGWQPLHP